MEKQQVLKQFYLNIKIELCDNGAVVEFDEAGENVFGINEMRRTRKVFTDKLELLVFLEKQVNTIYK